MLTAMNSLFTPAQRKYKHPQDSVTAAERAGESNFVNSTVNTYVCMSVALRATTE